MRVCVCVCVYIDGKASRDEHNLPWNNRKNRARIISGYVRPRFRPLFSFIHWTGFPLKTLNAQNGNLRGRRVTYYRIKYTVVADLSLPVCGAGTTYPPPPPPLFSTVSCHETPRPHCTGSLWGKVSDMVRD